MKQSIIIFFLALVIRIIYLFLSDVSIDSHIIEDQFMYWDWSSKGAYTPWSNLDSNVLSERMPGAFYFFEILMWLTGKDLIFILIIQMILDSFSCVILSKGIKLIFPEHALITGIFASISPISVVLSSQILSETLFLFLFISFLFFLIKSYKSRFFIRYLCCSGVCLGLASFTKIIVFPLVVLCPLLIFLIYYSKIRLSKIVLSMFLFFILSVFPSSFRIAQNYINNNTIALSSQTGSHLAYWVVPAVLSQSEGASRDMVIKKVNEKIIEEGGLQNDTYYNSKLLTKISMEIISEQKIYDITYSWMKGFLTNLLTSGILLDINVRKLPHPSFYEYAKIDAWLFDVIGKDEYRGYAIITISSFISSIFIFVSILTSVLYLLKKNKYILLYSLFLIIFFGLITGPIISPKYSFPVNPILCLFNAILIRSFFIYIFNISIINFVKKA